MRKRAPTPTRSPKPFADQSALRSRRGSAGFRTRPFILSAVDSLKGSTLSTNRVAASGPGNAEAEGAGAFKAFGDQTDSVAGSLVNGNAATAIASTGSAFADGSGLSERNVLVTNSRLSGNLAMASGSSATVGPAGAFSEFDVTLSRSTVTGNQTRPASTTGDADAEGAAVDGDGVIVKPSTISRNVAMATTSGAVEARATGAGIRGDGATVTNSTLALNKAIATSTGSAPAIVTG